MTTEANFPLQQLCLKPSLYGRFSLDHLWPVLGDHRGLDYLIANKVLIVRRIGSRVLIPAPELRRFARADHLQRLVG